MPHLQLDQRARLAITLVVLTSSVAAGGGTVATLTAVGAPVLVAAFPAALITIIGIITLTYGIETLLSQQQAPSSTR
jgi:hypothetical protein